MNMLSFTWDLLVNGTSWVPERPKTSRISQIGAGVVCACASNDEECHYVGMVASVGVLGSLKLSVRRDIITEDMLWC